MNPYQEEQSKIIIKLIPVQYYEAMFDWLMANKVRSYRVFSPRIYSRQNG